MAGNGEEKRGGRCREGMVSEKGGKGEEERGKKARRSETARTVAGIKSDKIITWLKWLGDLHNFSRKRRYSLHLSATNEKSRRKRKTTINGRG